MITTFTIEEFEADVQAGDHEPAARRLLELLTVIDAHHGGVAGLKMSHIPAGRSAEELERHVAARLADAIGRLFSNPAFNLSDSGFFDFIVRHRWMCAIFAATPLRNADHLIRMMGGVAEDGVHLKLDHPALLKLCVLYSTESDLSLNCDELWYRTPRVCAALLMALLSPRLTISANAHAKRESILGWLPSRLDQLQTAAALPQAFIHDVWMHCSYAMREDKHAIKAPLNRLVRQQLLDLGLRDVDTPYEPLPADGSKPTLLVMMEWFHSTHSVYRTHSKSVLALRERFHLVGLGMSNATDDVTRAMFDEFISVEQGDGVLASVQKAVETAERVRPQIVYYLGVGMFPHTIYTANLRLAPLQFAALGHAASTFAPEIDYFMLDEDFIGDVACFSEKVVALPIGSMPFTLPASMPLIAPRQLKPAGPIRIAVAASSMKLNPEFLAICAQAKAMAGDAITFQFIPAFATGLAFLQAKSEIERQVPGSTVYPTRPYAEYLEVLSTCDMFINPLPYGNMNTIVDTVVLGLPGLCATGREPHAVIDSALFKRLGSDSLRVAKSNLEYPAEIVAMALSIANDRARGHLPEPVTPEIFNQPGQTNLADVIIEVQAKHPQIMIDRQSQLYWPVGSSKGKTR